MKKFMKKSKKSTKPEQFDKLRNQLSLVEKHENGFKELNRSLVQMTEASIASVEQGKVFAETLRQYGVQVSSDNILTAGCLRTIGDFHKNTEELRLKMCNTISQSLQMQLKSFDEDIEDAKGAKKTFDKAQATYDSAVTREKKTKPSKATGEEKEKSKLTKAKEIYEDSGERAISQLINTNDRIQLMLLEQMCAYVDEYQNFCKRTTALINEIQPEVNRYREQAKKLKERIEEDKIKSEIDEKTFGVPLDELLRREGSEVPLIIQECMKYIEEKALDVEGLFRVPGDQKEIEHIRQSWDKGHRVDIQTIQNPHTVTGLMKLFLRQLPDPLLTFDSYENLANISRLGSDEEKQVALLTDTVLLIPMTNLKCVDALFAFCTKLATHSEANKMGTKNLATLIAPNILYPRHSTNILDELSHSARAVEFMIIRYDQIWRKLVDERIITEEKMLLQCKDQKLAADITAGLLRMGSCSPGPNGDGLLTDKQARITRRMAAQAKRSLIHRASLLTTLGLANEIALNGAFDDVLDRNAASGWIVIGYQNSSTLEFQKSGKGGPEELVQHLYSDQVQYAVIRVSVAKSSQTTKDILIAWSGPEVKATEVSKKKSHLGEVKELLKPFHAELTAVGKTNFNLDTLLDRSGPLSGSHIID